MAGKNVRLQLNNGFGVGSSISFRHSFLKETSGGRRGNWYQSLTLRKARPVAAEVLYENRRKRRKEANNSLETTNHRFSLGGRGL